VPGIDLFVTARADSVAKGPHRQGPLLRRRDTTIAARIWDLYGIKDALWVAKRRVRVRIQVLAPSNRPVQVTENLAAFWRETYPKLKQQLQRKYPKHEWR